MPHLDSTLGAALLGMLAAAVLYGVTTVQAFMFLHNYRVRNRDGWRLQGMVLLLWILDTIHLAFACHGIYYYLVTNFGNFKVLVGPTWSILAQVYLANMSEFVVRAFFAKRVSVLCGTKTALRVTLPCIIIFLSCIVFILGFALASRSFILVTYARMAEVSWMLYAGLGVAVVADTLIAVSLCWLLLSRRTGFKRTNDVVTSLLSCTINTGLLTSIGAIACFVTVGGLIAICKNWVSTVQQYAIWPDNFIFIGIYFALSKLYINSLLASLNARNFLRTSSDAVFSFQTGVSAPIVLPMKSIGTPTSSSLKEIGIMVETERT